MKGIFKFRLAGIGIMAATLAVFGAVVMLLWNGLMPVIFGLDALTYWQALGLLLLARIIFGGLGGAGRFGALGMRGGFHQGNPFREKWMNMTNDERMEFARTHRGFHGHPAFWGEGFGEKGAPAPDKAGGDGGRREQ
jgi:hypothetical protein